MSADETKARIERRHGLAVVILRRFNQFGPMTVKDCADIMSKPVTHIAPRVVELVEAGALVPDFGAGMRRAPTGRGRPAVVYRVADRACEVGA